MGGTSAGLSPMDLGREAQTPMLHVTLWERDGGFVLHTGGHDTVIASLDDAGAALKLAWAKKILED